MSTTAKKPGVQYAFTSDEKGRPITTDDDGRERLMTKSEMDEMGIPLDERGQQGNARQVEPTRQRPSSDQSDDESEVRRSARQVAAELITEDSLPHLLGGTRIIAETPWPLNWAERIGLHSLSRAQVNECRQQAKIDARHLYGEEVDGKIIVDPEDVQRCFRDEVVQRAFCGPARLAGAAGEPFNAGVQIWPSVEEMRDRLSEEVIESLWALYCVHSQTVAPLQQAEMRAHAPLLKELADRLKKKPEAAIELLSGLERTALEALLIFMVSPSENSP